MGKARLQRTHLVLPLQGPPVSYLLVPPRTGCTPRRAILESLALKAPASLSVLGKGQADGVETGEPGGRGEISLPHPQHQMTEKTTERAAQKTRPSESP